MSEERGAGAIGYFGCDEVLAPQNTVTGVVITEMKVTRLASWAGAEHFGRIIGTRNGSTGTIANNYVLTPITLTLSMSHPNRLPKKNREAKNPKSN